MSAKIVKQAISALSKNDDGVSSNKVAYAAAALGILIGSGMLVQKSHANPDSVQKAPLTVNR